MEANPNKREDKAQPCQDKRIQLQTPPDRGDPWTGESYFQTVSVTTGRTVCTSVLIAVTVLDSPTTILGITAVTHIPISKSTSHTY